MKVTKKETFEVDTASTELGEIVESNSSFGPKLVINLKEGCALTITKEEIRIEFHISRPCQDHDHSSTMVIKGFTFVDCVCGHHEEKRPTVTFENYPRPEIAEMEDFLQPVLWALEKKYGKLYGIADLKALSKVVTNSKEKDAGELVIRAYKNDDPHRHHRCVDIVASSENLALLLPMLKFVEEIRKKR
jgi:hypothetical protein